MPTTIKLTDRQTELLRAFFEYDGTVKMKWGRLAKGIGMERNAAKVQFGHLLGKMKAAVAAPDGYGHRTAAAAAAAAAPSVTTSTAALMEEHGDKDEKQDDEGLDEPANTTTASTPESAALTPVQSDGSTTTKYNKTCQACTKLQVHCEKTAGSKICSRCREKDIPCELMPRKEYSSVNRPKRKATTTNAVDATDPVISAPTPPAKKLKTAAPEATINDVAPRSRRYRAVDNEVSDDPDA
ncbi:hypothetical protein D6D19_04642 [Aureobasidium pullulans]|uniref:Zn(2)-C6 fungal-type domain-containing protein n=1 Tax=Aureobasidium pullulans TaxID=5580 RepID=A0A4S9A6E1_AURPU|nr:hypothetical protein D6D19_04642 [Aureobasidium pullulans]